MQAGISEDVDDAGMNCGKFANGLEKVTLAFDVGRVARAAGHERGGVRGRAGEGGDGAGVQRAVYGDVGGDGELDGGDERPEGDGGHLLIDWRRVVCTTSIVREREHNLGRRGCVRVGIVCNSIIE